MKSRLAKFLIVLALILCALEVFVRANSEYFHALSDKVLLKAKILERSPETKVLFIGSSRFLDAIDHKRFSEELESETGTFVKSLNGATTGFDGGRFAYFAEIAEKNEHLTHVILEASSPALQNGEIDFPDQDPAETTEVADDERKKKEGFADRFENDLQDWVSRNIALVKYRKSLRPKVFVKLIVLLTADTIDPNVWSRKGIVRNLTASDNFDVTGDFLAQFRPDLIMPSTTSAPPDDLNPNHVYRNLDRVSKILAGSRFEVIWVAPPVSREKRSGNHSRKFTRFYEAIARQYGSTFYDYAGLELEGEFFRDPTHLNRKGRALFSTVLAKDLAENFKD